MSNNFNLIYLTTGLIKKCKNISICNSIEFHTYPHNKINICECHKKHLNKEN